MRESTCASDIWATAVMSLNSEALKFALNAATDTLPTNNNLAKWRKGAVLDHCKLCSKKQTLLHVLNNCEKALQLRRYNTRHDRILSDIADLAQKYLPDEYHLTVDLGEASYQFPLHIVPTNLRPDLVMWSDVHRTLHLVELTVCFESGFDEAAERKVNRYSELAKEACAYGYHTTVLPIQIGSRGVLEETGLEGLRAFLQPFSSRDWKAFLIKLTCTTIEESYKIWCSRNSIG